MVDRKCPSGQSESIDVINDSWSRSALALFHIGQECNFFLFFLCNHQDTVDTGESETYCSTSLSTYK